MVSKRTVGVSILPAHVATSRTELAALQREFAQLRALDHPNIARLLELHCDGRQAYVTNERLDGEPLREVLTHLSPERLDAHEADDIVCAIGSALVYAHEQGVVHGDVRPENVLVTMDRRFLLTNFLSRRTGTAPGRARRRDDVAGLARLAAEIYTGSSSPHALPAIHSDVPAARVNAIRAVLETPRRSGSVAEFLAAAGLPFATRTAATARRSPGRERSSSFWRYGLPLAAVIAIGTLVASYLAGKHWPASVVNLQARALEVLRPGGTRGTPAPPAAASDGATTPSDGAESHSIDSAAAGTVAPPSPPETVFEPTIEALPDIPATEAAEVPTHNPTVLSMSVPRVAVREDHGVVVIDIVRSGDTTGETSVGWWVMPGTAEPDEDYATGGKQVISFPPGTTVQRLIVPIVDDDVREPDEVLTVHLSPPRNGIAGDVTATRVTVYDDD